MGDALPFGFDRMIPPNGINAGHLRRFVDMLTVSMVGLFESSRFGGMRLGVGLANFAFFIRKESFPGQRLGRTITRADF